MSKTHVWWGSDDPYIVDTWEFGDYVYAIEHWPGAKYPWRLNYAYHQGGGGSPFTSHEELEEHIRQRGIRPAQQMVLPI